MSASKLQGSDNTRRAALGAIIFDANGRLYGLTAKHFTEHAGGIVYFREYDDFKQLGKTSCNGNDRFPHDIDAFLIDKEQECRCDSTFKNANGDSCTVKLYQGFIEDLYNTDLYLWECVHPKQNTDSIFNIQEAVCDTFTLKKVKLACREVHETYKESIEKEVNFLVVNRDGHLIPGDSGSVLFFWNEDGSVELVGVLGGQFQVATDFVQCALLKSGLQVLGQKFQTTFYFTRPCPNKKCQVLIPQKKKGFGYVTNCPGAPIYFKMSKSPDSINPNNFDLLCQIQILVGSFGDSRDELKANRKEHEYEINLFRAVHARQHIQDKESETNSPDQACFYLLAIACNAIYSCSFEEAEETLKDAYRAVIKAVCKNRLLGKLIQLCSLLWLRRGDPENMDTLFTSAESFMNAMDQREFESLRILGYFCMNFAWYFNRKGKIEFAKKLADECLALFQKYRNDTGNKLQGFYLSRILLARLNLNCGEFFDTIDSLIETGAITIAERYLKEVDGDIVEMPVVRTHYRLARAELLFRQEKYRKALEMARECRYIAEQYKLGDAKAQAEAHTMVLGKFLS